MTAAPASSPPPGPRTPTPRRAAWWPAVLLVALFLAGAVPLWAASYSRGKGAFDQHYYHRIAIFQFARDWPHPDLSDYRSATTPGYHLVMAAAARFVTRSEVALQACASVFTVALLALYGVTLARRAWDRGFGGVDAFLLALPLLCTPYVFLPGVWLQPDNFAWLLVLSVLLVSLRMALTGPRVASLAVGGALLLALVLVRQSHVWTAGLLWAGAWIGAAPRSGDESLGTLVQPTGKRAGWLGGALVASLPAAIALRHFVHLWHGLVPPTFQTQISGGPNWAAPAFCLALIGIYALFLAGWAWPAVVRLWRTSRPAVLLPAALGVIAASIPATTFLRERLPDGTLYEPRATGLWNVVKVLDDAGLSIAHHTSPLILVLAPVGAVVLVALTAAARSPARWVLLAAVLGMIAAQTANPLCWQRYVEPLFLMVLPMMALAAASPWDDLDERTPGARWIGTLRRAGPLALALAMAALTTVSLARGERLEWPSELPQIGGPAPR